MKNSVICPVVLVLAVLTVGYGQEPATPGPSQEVGHAAEKKIALDLGGGVKMEFVLVPAGSFMMGDDAIFSNARPVHKVTITKPFYLGKYEVTQEQWKAVTADNPSYFKGPKNPVECVNWHDCQDFLAKLNGKFQTDGARFTLPTEAQWEYACRAGTTTVWSFGDDPARLGDYAWWFENAANTTHPVGQKRPNAWGLHDMHGNVYEWCADWYDEDYYRNSPGKDPAGPDSGTLRMGRGGCWDDRTHHIFRCGYRKGFFGPELRSQGVGFRVVAVPVDASGK